MCRGKGRSLSSPGAAEYTRLGGLISALLGSPVQYIRHDREGLSHNDLSYWSSHFERLVTLIFFTLLDQDSIPIASPELSENSNMGSSPSTHK